MLLARLTTLKAPLLDIVSNHGYGILKVLRENSILEKEGQWLETSPWNLQTIAYEITIAPNKHYDVTRIFVLE